MMDAFKAMQAQDMDEHDHILKRAGKSKDMTVLFWHRLPWLYGGQVKKLDVRLYQPISVEQVEETLESLCNQI